jgi:hypothetical protein
MRFGLLLSALIAASVLAAPATAPADENPPTVTRVYDISDLLWLITDYPAAGEGAAAGTVPAENTITRQELAENVIKLITDTVASDTWKDNGGTIGALRELNGQLIVTQTADSHKQIDELLHALRADRGRMVVVRAYWLLLDPASVPAVTTHTNAKELPVIDDKLLDAQHLYCAAQTTCFSGQTVHVTSGRTRSIVTSLTPVVANNAVGYQPGLERARSGVVLQLTPHLEPEGPDSRVVVDLQSNVTELGNLKGDKIEPPTTQPADTTTALDRVNEINQKLRTTVRLKLGMKVLVGGMTLEPASKDNAARQLYLVIEADAVK